MHGLRHQLIKDISYISYMQHYGRRNTPSKACAFVQSLAGAVGGGGAFPFLGHAILPENGAGLHRVNLEYTAA